jgi:hypothetical protein
MNTSSCGISIRSGIGCNSPQIEASILKSMSLEATTDDLYQCVTRIDWSKVDGANRENWWTLMPYLKPFAMSRYEIGEYDSRVLLDAMIVEYESQLVSEGFTGSRLFTQDPETYKGQTIER